MFVRFGIAFEYLLCGRKIRAKEWSNEYYLAFNGNIWLIPTNTLINVAQLNIWRQLYKEWEIV